MRDLHASIVEAKNRMRNIYPWLNLLSIVVPTTPPTTLHVASNNESIVFNGVVYTAASFTIIRPSSVATGEIPANGVYFFDVKDTIRNYLEDLNGGYGTTIKHIIVNSEYLDDADYAADLEFNYDLLSANISEEDNCCVLNIGAPNLLRDPSPEFDYEAENCRWVSLFGGFECKYPKKDNETCDGTLEACMAKGNTANFGGHPGLTNNVVRYA
jgi:hypothetical protein